MAEFLHIKRAPCSCFYSKHLKFYERNSNKGLSYSCNNVCKIDLPNDSTEIYRKASAPDSLKFCKIFRNIFLQNISGKLLLDVRKWFKNVSLPKNEEYFIKLAVFLNELAKTTNLTNQLLFFSGILIVSLQR